MRLEVVAHLAHDGAPISSRRVRSRWRAAMSRPAAACPRPPPSAGRQTVGPRRRRGRALGFPTANCAGRENPGARLRCLCLAMAEVGGQRLAAAVNVGACRPSLRPSADRRGAPARFSPTATGERPRARTWSRGLRGRAAPRIATAGNPRRSSGPGRPLLQRLLAPLRRTNSSGRSRHGDSCVSAVTARSADRRMPGQIW